MIETIINKSIQFLKDVPNKRGKYFSKNKDFTRKGKLDYNGVTINILNLPRRSMAVELDDYFERIGLEDFNYTKSAFSRARQKLEPVLFKDMSIDLAQNYYEMESKKIARWMGYRLAAFDGSRAYLMNTPDIINEFGTQDNQHGGIAVAQYLFGVDILNEVCLYADIAAVNKSETAMLVPFLQNDFPKDIIALYDRLFPSAFLLYLHKELNIPFVMRCKLGFNTTVKDFVASGQKDKIVDVKMTEKGKKSLKTLGYEVKKGQAIQIRLVRVELNSGLVEVLATTLLDQQLYPHHVFKGLYASRWGVETMIGRLKNHFQIEIFSSRTPKAIKQDFFATVFTYNLQTILIRSIDEKVEQINDHRHRKYQINRNVTLGILKGNIILMLLGLKPNIIPLLQKKFIKHLTEDTKYSGRSNPRNKKAQRINGKYRTFYNHARSI